MVRKRKRAKMDCGMGRSLDRQMSKHMFGGKTAFTDDMGLQMDVSLTKVEGDGNT